MENNKFKNFKNYKNERKNPKTISDFEMNEIIANRIIETIEAGNVQRWRRTWLTFNDFFTKEEILTYVNSGFISCNPFTLECFGELDGVPLGFFFVTFKDIKREGLHLKKGSKGEPHYKREYLRKFLTIDQKNYLNKVCNNPEGEEEEELKKVLERLKMTSWGETVSFEYPTSKGGKKAFHEKLYFDKTKGCYMYNKALYVLEYFFRLEDCQLTISDLWETVQPKDLETLINSTLDENKQKEIEEIKNKYLTFANCKYRELAQDKAYYEPAAHAITMPKREQFTSLSEYYETAFHEMAHSTGHPSLLNRKTLVNNAGFKSVSYSKEELVAELSSIYTLNALGILTDDILKNSIAYLKSWGDQLKQGIRHNILNTIFFSECATKLILKQEK